MRSLRPEVPEEDYFVMNGGAIAVAVSKKNTHRGFWARY